MTGEGVAFHYQLATSAHCDGRVTFHLQHQTINPLSLDSNNNLSKRVQYLCLIECARMKGDLTDIDDCERRQLVEMAQSSFVKDDIATAFDDKVRHVVRY
jgi:hypothetical protein